MEKFIKHIACAGIMSLVLTVGLSENTVKAASAQAVRISGADRYATAAQVAEKNWTTCENVVLVSGEGYADAVSASVLAKKLDAPILLTTPNTLSSDAKLALDTLKPKNVYVIGGNASISQNVRNNLAKSYNIVSLGGANRYETNVKVAEELLKLGVSASNVIVVGGEGFSDALSAAPVAAAKGEILLLANNNAGSIKPVVEFIKANKSKATVIGTQNVINDSTYNALGGTDRVNGGKDRFDTNLKVLDAFKDTLKNDRMYIASASNDGFADALVASAVAGKTSSPLILLDSEKSQATSNAVAYIRANAAETSDLNVIGGTGVVTDNMFDAINGKPSDDSIVTFKDRTLETVVRGAVNKPEGNLYKSDVSKITKLVYCGDHGAKIQDISGIENLINLKSITLSGNEIKDITPLSGLTNLQSIDLSGNQISDISALEKLTQLQYINLNCNQQISDIGYLKGLTNLSHIEVIGDQISDISVLKGLSNLQYLDLSSNKIEDISSLSGLTNLKNLSLASNQISDISPLKTLVNLQFLMLYQNQIKDITPLKGLTALQDLELYNNEVSDISSLSGLTNLQTLYLDGPDLKDISALKNLINLQKLCLNNSQVSDISALKGLVKLQYLSLGENKISDISALSGLTNLTLIDLVNNQISDITPLSGLIKLHSINLDQNSISDITALKHLSNLQDVSLVNDKVSDADIKSLKSSLPNCIVITKYMLDE